MFYDNRYIKLVTSIGFGPFSINTLEKSIEIETHTKFLNKTLNTFEDVWKCLPFSKYTFKILRGITYHHHRLHRTLGPMKHLLGASNGGE